MYRIDNNSAVPTLPAPGPPGTAGFFTDGNPAAALEATIVDAWWANIIQEEILTVITAAGITPSKASHTQLYEALNALYAGGAPVTGFLPITGGTLYNPNTSDLLRVRVSAGRNARILFDVDTMRVWSAGTNSGGYFVIGDENAGIPRVLIDGAGNIELVGQTTCRAATTTYPLTVYAAAGGTALIATEVAGRRWSTGTIANGQFAIGDVTAGIQRILIGNDGKVSLSNDIDVANGSLNVGGSAIISQGLTGAGGGTLRFPGGIEGAGGGAQLGVAAGLYVTGHTTLAGNVDVGGDYWSQGDMHTNSIDTADWAQFGGTLKAGDATLNSVDVTDWLDVHGVARNTSGTWATFSDRRVKKDIVDYERGLAEIRQLRPVAYRYNGLAGTSDDGKIYHGLIAQEALKVMPEMIIEDEPVYSMNCAALTFALINAVQELTERLEMVERSARHG